MRRTVSKIINEAARVATPVTFRSKEELQDLVQKVGPQGIPGYRRWQMKQIRRRIKADYRKLPRSARQEFLASIQDQAQDMLEERRREMAELKERTKPPQREGGRR